MKWTETVYNDLQEKQKVVHNIMQHKTESSFFVQTKQANALHFRRPHNACNSTENMNETSKRGNYEKLKINCVAQKRSALRTITSKLTLES